MRNIQDIKQLIRLIFIRPITQPLFEALHSFSIRMMNYGNALFENTGELNVFRDIVKKSNRLSTNKKNKDFVCLDIGGNIGAYAKKCIEIAHDELKNERNLKWISFEPAPITFEMCKQTLSPFKDAEVVQVAASNTIGHAKFKVASAKYIGTNRLLADHEDITNETDSNSIDVTVTTLDQFIQERGIDHVDFLKIDAEGFDLEVIKGAIESIKKNMIEHIQFEYGFSTNPHFLKEYTDILSPYYDLYRILPSGMRKLNAYNPDIEIALGINYLCIRK
jgi:FkbM family methyltransferase